MCEATNSNTTQMREIKKGNEYFDLGSVEGGDGEGDDDDDAAAATTAAAHL